MKLRKITATVLTLAMIIISLAACGKENNTDSKNTTAANAGTEDSTKDDGAAPAATDTALTDPFGKYADPVTIHLGAGLNPNATFPEGESIEKNDYLDMIKDTFNIDITYDWVASTTDLEQKVNMCIASNTLPDIMNVNATQYRAMLKYDQLQPITKAFDSNASDLLKSFVSSGGDALKDLISVDGEMMAIPAPELTSSSVNTMWIRQDWLDALGLEVPKTVEDLEKVAESFVTKDPDGNGVADTIGIVGASNTGFLANVGQNQFGFDAIFASYGSFPRYWLKDGSGNVTYGSIAPETKEALAKLADMYKKGLIDPELLVRSDSSEPVLAGKAGIFFGPWWSGYTVQNSVLENPTFDWQAYEVPLNSEGKFVSGMSAPTNQYIVVTKNCKNPEAAAKIINLLLRDEESWIASGLKAKLNPSDVYPLFNVYDNANEIEVSYDYLKKYMNGDITMDSVDFSTHKLLKNDMEVIKKLKKEPYDNYSIKNWDLTKEEAPANIGRLISIMVGARPLMEDGYDRVYSLYYGQTDTMASKWSNLEKLQEETFAKIVLGQASIDSFDTFTKNWLAQGGQDIINEVAEVAK
ncbi:extracellular solute-binding protein [Anaerocolumna xylanovorans]|uniref:Putative aldouronate transport system substrate-binding protein n=1 Tax=Anaerocolumna xylanovorans DSM 12503 TaxID=1121345 RepID=A0A1M7YMT7_9FIRM|nr:extracellular solute-binding protein [Anaerocolumna xylanovorans]SHO53887.1 putative aldouronate transport system substrate-binding protein [Anaerocolumna xylanovorans DSM 12503]